MAFWQRRAGVEEMLERYFALCDSCFESLEKSMATFKDRGVCPEFATLVSETHRAESEADDLRRELS